VRIRKFHHSCVLVEQGVTRLLIDPGSFSTGLDEVRDLTAILVTHMHGDHLDLDQVERVIERNPGVRVVCDAMSGRLLGERGIPFEAVRHGDQLDFGLPVRVAGSWHAVIHPDIPIVENIGYVVDERVFHPGDAFTDPGAPMEVVAVPAGAPWMKISEAIDWLRMLKPARAVPVHECVIANPASAHRMLSQLGPAGMRLNVLDDGSELVLSARATR
jgi:L-ascorbate metabolism protein UlaG (beta-lactamase superfamily)